VVEHFVAGALDVVHIIDVLVDGRCWCSQPARYIKIETFCGREPRRLAQRRAVLQQ
jgi:hypothetical protein